MAATNLFYLTGHLVGQAETKTLASGTTVCKRVISVPHVVYKRGGAAEDSFMHHEVNCYGAIADRLKDLPERTMVAVQGEVSSRTFDGRDGGTRIAMELVAREAIVLLAPVEEESF